MIAYRNLRNRVVNIVRMAKEKYYQDILKTNKGNTKEMKCLTGNKPKKYPSSLHVDNDTICSDLSEIAEHLNLYFTQIAENIIKTKVNPSNYCEYEPPTALKEFVNSKIPKKGGFIIPKVTDIQVEKLLKSLNLSKATGMDKISAKFVQMATPALVRPLCSIMNTSIETDTVPDLWKHAKVQKSETGLASILSEWQKSIDTGLLIGYVSIDLRKAFDLINYEILYKKFF